LLGLPGSGKTTVARALRDHIGWSWVDVDEVVEREVGCSISELIRVEGEQKFRALEAAALAQAIKSGARVISVGGGALSNAKSRALIEKEAIPIQLTVELEEGARRVVSEELRFKGTGESHPKRPLLFPADTQANFEVAKKRLAELGVERAEQYRLAKIRFSTDFTHANRLAEVLSRETENAAKQNFMEETVLSVISDSQSEILVGQGLRKDLGARLRGYFPDADKLVLVIDENVRKHFGAELEQSISQAGFTTVISELPSGETSKSAERLLSILAMMAENEVSRDDVLVGCGGGVVGDISGFAASVYMRGIEQIQIPTTLVAQVDSAIGGKTAVNLPQGKNLVGTFHPAKAVLSDPSFLTSLPEREYFSGMAEVVKYGLVFSGEFFEWIEGNIEAIRKRNQTVLSRIVERSSLFKTEVVVKDLYDRTGLRAQLNFGHTVGHAIEKLAGYGELLHGEAVAIGMMEALFVSSVFGTLQTDVLPRVALLLQAFGLPTAVPERLLSGASEYLDARGIRSGEALRAKWAGRSEGVTSPKLSKPAHEFESIWQKALRADKKRGSGGLKFILLEQIGLAKVVPVDVEKVVDCVALRSHRN